MKSNPQTCQPPTALAAIVAALALALPATAASPEIGPLPYFNMYGPVFANAELIGEVKIERLGEPVEGAQIERRTAMFLPPGTASPIIAEQHYWVGPGAGGSSESPQPLRALDTGGGQLVWSTAMAGDRVIVKVKGGVSVTSAAGTISADAMVLETIAPNTFTLSVPFLLGVDEMLKLLRAMPGVEFAEPDHLGLLFTDLEQNQWHLQRINADAALPVTGAGAVAVLDTGIVTNHLDLVGKVDTVNGWNHVNNNGVLTDLAGHGTHVAGLISAIKGNGIGVRGICPNVKIVPLRVGTYNATTGEVTVNYSHAISAMTRIRAKNPGAGITVANHSWGGDSFNEGLYQSFINYGGTGTSPVPDPADPNPVKATWSGRSRKLTLSGSAEQKALIKEGMKVIGAGLKTGSRCLARFDDTGAGAFTHLILSELPDNIAGSSIPLSFESEPISLPYNVLNVAAAGNDKRDLDITPIFPACLPSHLPDTAVICVGGSSKGTDANEKPTDFGSAKGSNYGKYLVDLFAPGTDMWSTYKLLGGVNSGYLSVEGTSSSAALVSAAAALIRIKNPGDSMTAWRNAAIMSVEKPAGLLDKCDSDGRLKIAP